jgi:EAL and modified HD-GYP domain-containing signal transduction protein
MEKQNYLGRQPVLDRERKIIGYELFYRSGMQSAAAQVQDDLAASAQVLVSILNSLDSDWLPPGKLVFLNVSAAMLLDPDFLALLPDGRVVLDIYGKAAVTPELLAACDGLRARHIGLALDDAGLLQEGNALLGKADFFKVDVNEHDATQLFEVLGRLERFSARRVAKKVETGRDFKFCHDAGFDCFQGYYFARPETVSEKAINPGQMNLTELLNLVGRNAEAAEIEAVFKRDPVLMVKILGYINSPAMGLSRKVTGIPQALALLGYRQLYRWVALLLYTAGSSVIPPALTLTVLTRSRFIELLGKAKLPRQEQDNLFIVGMLSMLGIILETPLENVVGKLHVPESISRALLKREGVYGPFLELAEACENCDAQRMDEISAGLEFTAEDVNGAHLAAISWAEAVNGSAA